MEVIKTCLPEEFKGLKLKPYRNIPRALLKAVIKELPDYAAVVYLTLYDLAEANFRYPGTVVISHQTLSQEIGKSPSSTRRAIETLKELGFIEIKSQGVAQKNYLPNIIRVCCPEALFQKIAAKEPNRKPKGLIAPTPSLKPIEEAPALINEAKQPEPFALYEQYQEIVKELSTAGASPLVVSQRAYQNFSKEDAASLQQFILGLPVHKARHLNSPTPPKMAGGCSKMNTIRSINNRDQNLLLTIENEPPVDKVVEPQSAATTFKTPIVAFEKRATVVHLLSESNKTEVIRKIKAMARYHEIHNTIRARYQNNLPELIREIIFHIQHRNPQKFECFKHALNACAKMLRQGTWSTPKRLLQENSIGLEFRALQEKLQEQEQALAFLKTTNLDFGFGRIKM